MIPRSITPLMNAILYAKPEVVSALIKAVDSSGRRPLNFIAQGDTQDEAKILAVLDILVGTGALLEAKNKDGITAFQMVCTRNFPKIIARMIELGADPHAIDARGCNAAHHCASSGTGSMHEIIRHGINVELANNNANTPLHTAAFNGHLQAAKTLLEIGVNTLAQNKDGLTAKQAAQSIDQHNVVAVFEVQDARIEIEKTMQGIQGARLKKL